MEAIPGVDGSLNLFAPSHVGIVADDMDAAMVELGRAWKTRWTSGRDGTVAIPFQARDGIQTVNLRTSWGERGPLRVELVQAVAGTIWAPAGGTYLHHLGYGVSDLELEARKLIDQGLVMELTRSGAQPGSINGFGFFRFAGGLLVELVSKEID